MTSELLTKKDVYQTVELVVADYYINSLIFNPNQLITIPHGEMDRLLGITTTHMLDEILIQVEGKVEDSEIDYEVYWNGYDYVEMIPIPTLKSIVAYYAVINPANNRYQKIHQALQANQYIIQ